MSKAYKCDRCGNLFEKHGRPFWIESDLRPNVKLDICDLCKAEFEHWFTPVKEEPCTDDNELADIEEDIRANYPCHRCAYYKKPLDADVCFKCHNADHFKEPSCSICKYSELYSFDEPCNVCIRETHSLFELKEEVNDDQPL